MYIHIPTGERINAKMTGQALKEVKCENCGVEFVYIVRSEAMASGFNPMYLDHEGAADRARKRVQAKLNRQLRVLIRPVPCPQCGWYQRDMVQILLGRRMAMLALIVALPLIWLGLRWIFSSDEDGVNLHAGFWVGLSLALAFLAGIFHFTRSVNDNSQQRVQRDPTSGGSAMLKTDYQALIANETSR